MSDASVIKEFLVAIGYKHDEAALKKVTSGIASVTKAAFTLGTVIEATALAVAVGVARFASNLEQLYFAAQRTGSSADSLQAFGLAARNFGSSIEAAHSSVENLAAFMRNTWGGSDMIGGWLGSMGLSARGMNGEMLTGTKLMAQLGKMFALMRANGQTPRANQIAGQLGIDDKTMLAISSPGWAEEEERQEKRTKGWEATAKAAHAFMIQLENLKMQFLQMMLGFEGPAMKALEGAMTKIATFMRHHGKQMVTDLSDAFTWVIDGLGKVLDWLDKHAREVLVRVEALFLDFNFNWSLYIKPTLDWLLTQFLKLDEATNGWSTKIAAVALALKALGGAGIVSGITAIGAGLAKGLGGLLAGAATASEGAGVWAAAGIAFGGAAALAIGGAIGWALDHFFPNNPLAKAGEWLGGKAADLSDFIREQYKSGSAHMREYNAVDTYEHKAYAAQRDAEYNPNFQTILHISVTGAKDPHETARWVASATDKAVSDAARDLVREFAATLR